MSIPQICPCCSNHISEPHHPDCSFGAPEYTHLGWPNYTIPSDATSNAVLVKKEPAWTDHTTAIRRLLEYLEDEPDDADKPDLHAITILVKRSEELRKEAAGMYNDVARAKRIFAALILDQLVEDLQATEE